MAARRTTFGKLQRDRAKKAKATAKRERREERDTMPEDDDAATVEEEAPQGAGIPQDEVLERIRTLHERFDDGAISFDEFEKQKAALFESLAVD